MRQKFEQLTDSVLVSLFTGGSEDGNEAFGILFERHREYVFNYLRKALNYNHQLAQDFTQDVFIKAMQSLRSNTYKEKNTFKFWLITIARNIFFDYTRKEKRVLNVLNKTYNTDLFGSLDSFIYEDNNKENELIKKETDALLIKYVKQLNPDLQEVVILRYFAGRSYKEIANILSKNKISINTYLGRGRYSLINLRQIVKNHKILN